MGSLKDLGITIDPVSGMIGILVDVLIVMSPPSYRNNTPRWYKQLGEKEGNLIIQIQHDFYPLVYNKYNLLRNLGES